MQSLLSVCVCVCVCHLCRLLTTVLSYVLLPWRRCVVWWCNSTSATKYSYQWWKRWVGVVIWVWSLLILLSLQVLTKHRYQHSTYDLQLCRLLKVCVYVWVFLSYNILHPLLFVLILFCVFLRIHLSSSHTAFSFFLHFVSATSLLFPPEWTSHTWRWRGPTAEGTQTTDTRRWLSRNRSCFF